jgi:hypothetical protein
MMTRAQEQVCAEQAPGSDPIAEAVEFRLATFIESLNFAAAFAAENATQAEAGLPLYSVPEYVALVRDRLRMLVEREEQNRMSFERVDEYLWSRACLFSIDIIEGINRRADAISDEEWAEATETHNHAAAMRGLPALSLDEYRRFTLRVFGQQEILSRIADGRMN